MPENIRKLNVSVEHAELSCTGKPTGEFSFKLRQDQPNSVRRSGRCWDDVVGNRSPCSGVVGQ